MRVVIAEDSVLLREGMARLLSDEGIEVIAQVDNADAFVSRVKADPPDVSIVDVRMPPDHNVAGLVAATQLRSEMPDFKVLILSQYVEPHYALELLETGADGVGYLLKERIGAPSQFIEKLHVVAEGGTAIDPDVVSQLFGRPRRDDPVNLLTEREKGVLAAMAEGKTNAAIADSLFMSEKTVESHVRNIFMKLDLHSDPDTNRRVLAVLRWLRQ
ncbi:MAG TPA: response regulator transcription factor [Acidimicrobiia bacterium]|nr:response regulator transcription factor [Acidimicrobiia bacterium]